jgi:phosphotriesterase-related protein
VAELQERVDESLPSEPVRAGFIKIACTSVLDETPGHLLAASAEASRATGAALLVHTEQGASAEQIVERLTGLGAGAQRIVLCHMDKRPDHALHQDLADAGVLLEYDTFFRPKYDPERNVWPLIERMLADGYRESLALGTDLADADGWRRVGPAGLLLTLGPRLRAMGCSEEAVTALVGRNIVARLVGATPADRV